MAGGFRKTVGKVYGFTMHPLEKVSVFERVYTSINFFGVVKRGNNHIDRTITYWASRTLLTLNAKSCTVNGF